MTQTKQNKTKGILYLIAVAIMVAMMSIACKKKATDPVAAFSSEEVAEETTVQLVYKSANGFSAEIVGDQIKVGYKDYSGGQGDLVINKVGVTSIDAKNSGNAIKGFVLLRDGNVNNTDVSNRITADKAEPKFDSNGNLTSIVFSGNNYSPLIVNFN